MGGAPTDYFFTNIKLKKGTAQLFFRCESETSGFADITAFVKCTTEKERNFVFEAVDFRKWLYLAVAINSLTE